MRAVSPLQVALYIVILVIGIAAGYAVGSSTAPTREATVTVTQQVAGQVVTSRISVTTTMVSTVTQPAGLSGDIPIGALLPLSGTAAGEGARLRVAAELAIDDLNSYVKTIGLPITFRLLVEDTGTDPTTALAKLQALHARGVKVFVGPYSSVELRNVLSYADSNKLVLCSTSTSPALAVPGYKFRLAPPDTFQGRALGRLIYDYGIRYIYILYRNDPWGQSLADATEARFKELGVTVLGRAGYDPNKSDFSAELSAAETAVKSAIDMYGADKVAVHLMSFEEGATIVSQAAGYPDLMKVTWFGSDPVVLSYRMLEIAGQQLAQVKLLSTVFVPTDSPKLTDFINKFKARTGEIPGTYQAVVYDCAMLLGLSIIQAGKYDGEAVKNAFQNVAMTYFGVTGWTILDKNGDRAGGNYGVWAVVMENGKPTWEKVAVVDTGTDTVTWIKKI